MFGQSGNKKKKDEQEGLATKSARGNMDEYEALRTIVAENSGLLARVLEKLRVNRGMSGAPATKDPRPEDPKDKKK